MIRRASRWLAAAATLALAGSLACSAPTLEDPQCADAQDRLRRFYSLHFDEIETGAKTENEARSYLTSRLTGELAATQTPEGDYFTAGDRFPKAFRVGTCTLRGDQTAEIDVLLLWRTDEESEQRSVRVKMARAGEAWRVDGVSPL
jgi:hypothetical protein